LVEGRRTVPPCAVSVDGGRWFHNPAGFSASETAPSPPVALPVAPSLRPQCRCHRLRRRRRLYFDCARPALRAREPLCDIDSMTFIFPQRARGREIVASRYRVLSSSRPRARDRRIGSRDPSNISKTKLISAEIPRLQSCNLLQAFCLSPASAFRLFIDPVTRSA